MKTQTRFFYIPEVDDNLLEMRQASAQTTWHFWQTCAKMLSITIDEFIDFMTDMEIEPLHMSLEELEAEYADYCREFDIPCMQFADYACIDRMGW